MSGYPNSNPGTVTSVTGGQGVAVATGTTTPAISLNGTEAVVLALKAKDGRPVTYSDIDYWIDAKTKRPLLAEYKSTSGKVLKLGYFEGYEAVFGVQRPTVLRMVDKLNGTQTLLKFKDAQKADLPALLFEKQNLGRS